MLHVAEPRTVRLAGERSTLRLSDITRQASRLPDFDGHERVWLGRDEARGLTAIVAIHDTTLGPALGGTRVWPHESFDAALTDALRLARGMSYKAAIAGLPLGGGKAVIVADPKTGKTPALLEAYAEMLAALDGQFITAEDVGLTLADADFLRARTRNVCGTTAGGSGNPSPMTALGVFLGLKAALRHRTGSAELRGRRVAIQGLGAVGLSLAQRIHAEGGELVVSDIDAARVERAVGAFAAETVDGDAILSAKADVFAPCALGGVLSEASIPRLGARIVAGAANNQLFDAGDGERLRAAGILYAPDYVINAGGLINVAAEFSPRGYDRQAAEKQIRRIPETLAEIFRRAESEGRGTEAVAAAIALERMARPLARLSSAARSAG